MNDTLIGSHLTRAGSIVEVSVVTSVRVLSMSQVEPIVGPVWRCWGCGEGSDEPLVNTALGDPGRIVDSAASCHAVICRS